MPGSPHESAPCACGQVVFDLSGHKVGKVLTCPWCRKKHRFVGSSTIVPLTEAEAAEAEREEEQEKREKEEAAKAAEAGKRKKEEEHAEAQEEKEEAEETEDEEAEEAEKEEAEKPEEDEAPLDQGAVMQAVTVKEERYRFTAPDEDKPAGSDVTSRLKSHASRRKRQQAKILAAKGGGKAPEGSRSSRVKPQGIHGSPLRMVAYIVICNAIALILLHFLFPAQRDGRRLTPWEGVVIPRFSVPWPELAALLVGHLVAFALWAHYLFGLHKRMQAQAAEQAAANADAAKNAGGGKPARKGEAAKEEDLSEKELAGKDEEDIEDAEDEDDDAEEDDDSDDDEDDDTDEKDDGPGKRSDGSNERNKGK